MITYWQRLRQQKLGIAPDEEKKCKDAIDVDTPKELTDKGVEKKEGKKCKNTPKKSTPKKRIKPRGKKQAKKMRELAKINKEMLRDPTEVCEIQAPGCTYFATVLNHNEGRIGDNLLDRTKMAKCCPPCNDYIEKHPDFAGGKFKKPRHHKK